jgi:hypothetical protein
MGKAARVKPDPNDPDAVSQHLTPVDYSCSVVSSSPHNEAPPSYGESQTLDSTEHDKVERAGRVANFNDNYSLIQLGGESGRHREINNKKSSLREISARMDPRLLDRDELFRYIDNYLQWLPPTPAIFVEGWHKETGFAKEDGKGEERSVTIPNHA